MSHEEIPSKPAWLFILNWPLSTVGGVNESVLALAHHIRELGYHPIIGIASWDGDPQPSKFQGIEVQSIRVREPVAKDLRVRQLLGCFATFGREMKQLSGFIRIRNVQVINPHYPGTECLLYAAMKTCGMFKGKLLISVHGSDVATMQASSGFARRLMQWCLVRADAVVACSKDLRAKVQAFASTARVSLIYNGVDPEAFVSAAPGELKSSILHVGKFDNNKGQDIVLAALQSRQAELKGLQVCFVGANGPQWTAIQAQASEWIRVLVDVPHAEIPELMAGAQVFVLPSRSEGLPLVLLEAGAAGLAVIATRVGGIPEIIEDGVNGLLIPRDDADALARALARLLTNEEERRRLAEALHRDVLERWTWAQAAGKYRTLAQGR